MQEASVQLLPKVEALWSAVDIYIHSIRKKHISDTSDLLYGQTDNILRAK